ncbi:MAG: hypothetical protein AAF664_04295 [Planctomycetota bacterium]
MQDTLENHRVSRLISVVGITLGWCGLFWASLSVAKLRLGVWKSLCGPWGCLPETAPVLSVHLMWLTTLGAMAFGLRFTSVRFQQKRFWRWMLLTSAMMIATYLFVIGGRFGFSWDDLPKRAAFYVVAMPDLPLIQLALISFVNLLWPGRIGRGQVIEA